MTRVGVWFLNAMIAGSICAAGETLPQQAPDDPLAIEPPMLLQNRADETGASAKATAGDPGIEIAKLEKDLARARRNAEGCERLYKRGIIAKADAEARLLKVVQLTAKLADARLAAVKNATASHRVNEAGSEELSLAQAAEAARRAGEERKRAELEAALRDLARQQKLLALGSGRKADVSRAEQKLAALQQTSE